MTLLMDIANYMIVDMGLITLDLKVFVDTEPHVGYVRGGQHILLFEGSR